MKRLNPQTNKPFCYGDIREDGKLFLKYKTKKLKKDGYFEESWLCFEKFQVEKARMLEHQKINSKQHNKAVAKWAAKNKDKNNARVSKYRSTVLLQTPKWLTGQQLQEISEFYKMAKQLETVFPWKQHVDHIVPLQGKNVCGLHTPWNLQILSETHNKQKSNRVEL